VLRYTTLRFPCDLSPINITAFTMAQISRALSYSGRISRKHNVTAPRFGKNHQTGNKIAGSNLASKCGKAYSSAIEDEIPSCVARERHAWDKGRTETRRKSSRSSRPPWRITTAALPRRYQCRLIITRYYTSLESWLMYSMGIRYSTVRHPETPGIKPQKFRNKDSNNKKDRRSFTWTQFQVMYTLNV
jgi:hypothetical protein